MAESGDGMPCGGEPGNWGCGGDDCRGTLEGCGMDGVCGRAGAGCVKETPLRARIVTGLLSVAGSACGPPALALAADLEIAWDASACALGRDASLLPVACVACCLGLLHKCMPKEEVPPDERAEGAKHTCFIESLLPFTITALSVFGGTIGAASARLSTDLEPQMSACCSRSDNNIRVTVLLTTLPNGPLCLCVGFPMFPAYNYLGLRFVWKLARAAYFRDHSGLLMFWRFLSLCNWACGVCITAFAALVS